MEVKASDLREVWRDIKSLPDKEQRDLRRDEVMRSLGVSIATFYRLLKKSGAIVKKKTKINLIKD